ncbi:MAG: acyl-protein synthetase [Bryobacteraceae bacterium]
MTRDEILALPQYSLAQEKKDRLLTPLLVELTASHRRRCAAYDRVVAAVRPNGDIPFLPTSLFKTYELRSVPEAEVFKTLTSSGTTGQSVSRIFLDKATALLQTTALSKIMTHFLGPERLPMILVETASVVKNRAMFSARGAGLVGMMNFGRQHFYALDDQMALDEAGLRAFLEKFGRQPFLIFGFTFMVWQYFHERVKALGMDLSNGILIHSGGWKKLQELAVSNRVFKQRLRDATGLARIHNFYGMVEQVGGVFMEGEDGWLHPPNFADVIVRDPMTWREQPVGVPGVIQVLSILPESYPGHSILTEDLGVVHSVDAGVMKGKAFSVIGRVPKAELRGCSDTHAAEAVR